MAASQIALDWFLLFATADKSSAQAVSNAACQPSQSFRPHRFFAIPMWTAQPSGEYILVLGVQERYCVPAMHIFVCGEQSSSSVPFSLSLSSCDCLKVIIFPSCHLRWFSAKANISPSQTTAQSVSALCYEKNTRFFFLRKSYFLCHHD